jgi:hypothetical protein
MTDAPKPTTEQANIIDAASTGDNVLIEAGAGCGKTTSLKQIAKKAIQTTKSQRLGYIAYNRSIADEARASFPRNTTSKTSHAFAMQGVDRSKLELPFTNRKGAAYALNIREGVKWGDGETSVYYSPEKLAGLAQQAVGKFCQSADRQIGVQHVRFIPGAEEYMDELRTLVVPYAVKLWADLSDPRGKLRFASSASPFDIYLKTWSLSDPKLPFDTILFDEAQDSNPVTEHVVNIQDAQIIMVGDSAQQIYAWRGAEDAMGRFAATHRLALSQSFRFGPAVAEEANKWLELIAAPLRLKGYEPIKSELGPVDEPKAILCRTNAGVISAALSITEETNGHTFGVVGGTKPIKMLAEAARDLMNGRGTSHPELMGFNNWEDAADYAADEGSSELKVFVKLVESYGVDKMADVAERAVDEKYKPDILISTAHKAKGREWDTVRINSDFQEPTDEAGEPCEPQKGECMLAYVSVTRAMQKLDRGSLAWVDNHLAGRVDEKPIPKALRKLRARKDNTTIEGE